MYISTHREFKKHHNEILRLNFILVSTVSEARYLIFFDSLMQTTHKTKMKILLLVAKKCFFLVFEVFELLSPWEFVGIFLGK